MPGLYRTMTVGIASDDDWFQNLPSNARLLFFILWNSRGAAACGLVKTTLATLSFETALTREQTQEAMDVLCGPYFSASCDADVARVEWWPAHNVAFIRNFYRHQQANAGETFRQHAAKSLREFPQVARDTVLLVYPELASSERKSKNRAEPPGGIDRVSIGYGEGIDRVGERVSIGSPPNRIRIRKENLKDTVEVVDRGVRGETREEPPRPAPRENVSPLRPVPKITSPPEEVRQRHELRALFEAACCTVLGVKEMRSVNKGSANAWFNQWGKRLTREIIEYALNEVGTHTEGGKFKYFFSVMERVITDPEDRAGKGKGNANGKHRQSGGGFGNGSNGAGSPAGNGAGTGAPRAGVLPVGQDRIRAASERYDEALARVRARSGGGNSS